MLAAMLHQPLDLSVANAAERRRLMFDLMRQSDLQDAIGHELEFRVLSPKVAQELRDHALASLYPEHRAKPRHWLWGRLKLR